MDNEVILILVILCVLLVVLYFYKGKLCNLCPTCGEKASVACPSCKDCPVCEKCVSCPKCVVPNDYMLMMLDTLARSCTYKLRGIMRESVVDVNEVQYFMQNGDSKSVVITNFEPEKLIKTMSSVVNESNDVNNLKSEIEKLSAVNITSKIVNGHKNYIVMALHEGKMASVGNPTNNFVEAFNNLEKTARSKLGPDTNTLVLFIDEDVSCPSMVISKPDEPKLYKL